jgi:hypothetical protein
VVNTAGDTSKPEASSPANDVREETLIAHVRHAAGVDDLPVTITGVARWRATSDVARRFRSGRVFLAGDSAHLMPPNGGYGGNTGIHDGHNLAWKLALVLNDAAGQRLLDTYDAERRPAAAFTVEQAYTRYVTRTAPFLGKQDFQPPADDFDIELGYLYRSPAIVPRSGDDAPEGVTHEHPRESRGRPGSRAPHVWIHEGDKMSTLDLFRGAFVLLTGEQGQAWFDAAAIVGPDSGFPGDLRIPVRTSPTASPHQARRSSVLTASSRGGRLRPALSLPASWDGRWRDSGSLRQESRMGGIGGMA